MEKSDFRVLIKHYLLRGKSIKENEEKLEKYYKEFAPSHGMVRTQREIPGYSNLIGVAKIVFN